MSPHPKFLLNGTGVGLRVQAVHVVVDGAELAGRDGGVATETCLKNGIVDEDILLLKTQHPHCGSIKLLGPLNTNVLFT